MYHALQIEPDPKSPLIVSQSAFAMQMMHLRRMGYQTASMSQLALACQRKAAIPRRTVVITFDDGYESVVRIAKPVLDDCGFSATAFVVCNAIGSHNFWSDGKPRPRLECLGFEGLRELIDAGWEIGS